MIDLQTLSEKLDELKGLALLGTKRVLTLEDAALLTGYSKPSLYRMTSQREIPHSKRGGKVFFDREQLEAWLLEGRVATTADIEQQANTYLLTHKK